MKKQNIERYALVFLLLLFLYLSFKVVGDMILMIFMGGLIAYIIFPLQSRLEKGIRSERGAALILSTMSLIVVSLFLLVLMPQVLNETDRAYDFAQKFTTEQTEKARDCGGSDNLFCNYVAPFLLQEDGSTTFNLSKETSSFVVGIAKSSFSTATSILVGLMVFFFSIYYFLWHGDELEKDFLRHVPLKNNHKMKLWSEIRNTIDGVIKGNIAGSVLQGIIGGIGFFIVGIPSALLWTVIMTIMSFLPTIGAAVIWVPAVIILGLGGSIGKALIVLITGLLMGVVDNFIKPKIMSTGKSSPYIVFIGVLGGLAAFGFIGLFIGPIILAIFLQLLEFYKEDILELKD